MSEIVPATGHSPAPLPGRAEVVDVDHPLYTMQVACELTGLHPQTLRKYDRRGVVVPARTAGGERRYSQRDVDRLLLAKFLVDERGLNLAGVQAVIELAESLEAERERAAHQQETIRRLSAELADLRSS